MKDQIKIDWEAKVPCKVCHRWVKRKDALSFFEISFICNQCLEKEDFRERG